MSSFRSPSYTNRPASWLLDVPSFQATSESQANLESEVLQDEAPILNPSGFQQVSSFHSTAFQQVGLQDAGVSQSIVKIESRFENEQTGHAIWKIGTGWLIRPDLVVTGGDVVYDAEYQLGAATQIKCFIGYRGQSSEGVPNQPRYGRRVLSSSEWDGSDKRARDIAFIQVTEPYTTAKTFQEVKLQELEPVFNMPQPEQAPVERFVPVAEDQPICVLEKEPEVPEEPKVQQEPAIEEEIKPELEPIPEPPATTETDNEDFEVVEEETPTTSVTESSPPADPFYEVLKAVASVDDDALDTSSPLLDDVGSLSSIAAGALLSYVVEAKSISSGEATKVPGAAERALLAEAAFQAILAIEESAELDEVLDSMKQIWTSNAPDAGQVSAVLSSYLAEVAPEIVSYKMDDTTDQADKATKLKRRALAIRNFTATEIDGNNKDFIKGLFAPTLPLAGREDAFSSVGPVLRSAVSADVQLVSQAGKATINENTPKLLQKLTTNVTDDAASSTSIPCEGVRGQCSIFSQRSLTTNASLSAISDLPKEVLDAQQLVSYTSGDVNHRAPLILVQRAIMADAALQAISTLPQQKLEALRLLPLDAPAGIQAETIFDFLKRVVQRIGPLALQPAKDAVIRFTPLLIDAPPKVEELVQIAPVVEPVKVSRNRLALRDVLHKKTSVKAY